MLPPLALPPKMQCGRVMSVGDLISSVPVVRKGRTCNGSWRTYRVTFEYHTEQRLLAGMTCTFNQVCTYVLPGAGFSSPSGHIEPIPLLTQLSHGTQRSHLSLDKPLCSGVDVLLQDFVTYLSFRRRHSAPILISEIVPQLEGKCVHDLTFECLVVLLRLAETNGDEFESPGASD
jgi:hypothetical protein